MAYQPSWFIQCQIHNSRKAVVMLFNPELVGYSGSYFSQMVFSEKERNIATGVRTSLQ